jgi:cytochrome c oxidase subunit 3/cytochrome o ubiquinol oxidase subunit 3
MSHAPPSMPEAGHAGLASFPPAIPARNALDAAQWGMAAFLVSEAALFGTLLMTYATFMGADTVGPTPREVLSLPLVIGMTICLLSSSATIHFAESAARAGRSARFCLWWGATIALGAAFIAGTAYEWHDLIEHQLTISRNLFGTTYYTLVGFHGLHVTIGIVVMLVVLGLVLSQQLASVGHRGLQLVSWYWHFVDAVWIAVFTMVYVIGR